MRVLVTGGAGFIGSNLAEALLTRGDDVVVLDNFVTGRRENLAEASRWADKGGARFELVEGDMRDAELVRRVMKGIDAVLHEAALPSVARSVDDPLTSHQVNVTGTLHLLLAARDEGVKRFVAASSSSLYGESESLPKIETMAKEPISPYGLDKLATETYTLLFHRLYGLPTVALRYFNVFGRRQDPGSDYSAVIPKFVTLMQQGKAPMINGDGGHTRDFTYIDNVIDANLKSLEAGEEALGKTYNVACGERISLIELVEAINEVLGTKIEPTFGPERAGDIRHSLADIERARTLLGYEPKIDLSEGLRRTVDWYRDNA